MPFRPLHSLYPAGWLRIYLRPPNRPAAHIYKSCRYWWLPVRLPAIYKNRHSFRDYRNTDAQPRSVFPFPCRPLRIRCFGYSRIRRNNKFFRRKQRVRTPAGSRQANRSLR